MGKLTETQVHRLRPGESVWDGELKGFGVRMQRRDAVFVLRYRLDGRQRHYSIGAWGKPWTVERARSEARRLWGTIAQGQDPQEQRQRYETALVVADLAKMFLLDIADKRKATTEQLYRLTLHKHVLPAIGNKRAEDVRRNDLLKLHSAIGVKRAVGSGGKMVANRALMIVRAMYNWANDRELVANEFNPARRLRGVSFKEMPRARLPTLDEVRRIELAIEECGISPSAQAAIRLLLLTGCRRNEILRLKWGDVDFERDKIKLADTKTGDHVMELADEVRGILTGIEIAEGQVYVIAGSNIGQPNEKPRADGLQKPWARVLKHAGLKDMHLHDLRHAWASIGAAAGIHPMLLSKAMRHHSVRMTERYSHLMPNAVSETQRKISGLVSEAMGRRPTASNVLRLPSKA